MLSEEEVEEIKEKIISHIKKTFPEEKADSAIEHIEGMNSEQLEKFLEENKILVGERENDCIFCLISSGNINSVKIGENKNAIAVLEINPVSRGHTIIIPKKHSQKIDSEIYSFSDEVSERIKNKLKPKRVDASKSKIFGHEIINLVPVYTDENINSPKNHAEISELEKIRNELERTEEVKEKSEETEEKIDEEEKQEFLWLPKRIP